jgi:uncharacterized protein with PIN domain
MVVKAGLRRPSEGSDMAEDRHEAEFRFYQELNDFLPLDRRQRWFPYRFRDSPAVKHAIETLGVPHTEVDLILVNGASVGFDYRLQPGDRVSVYPVFESLDISPVTRLRPRPLREPRFICDVHLGKLSRRLRLLGFDTAYDHWIDDRQIVEIALADRRIILTRDRGLLKMKDVTHGYLVRSPSVHEQVLEVLKRFELFSQLQPFTRCMRCNGTIVSVPKLEVQHRVPVETRDCHDEFFQCAGCGKVYWKGSHFARMEAEIRLLQGADTSTIV